MRLKDRRRIRRPFVGFALAALTCVSACSVPFGGTGPAQMRPGASADAQPVPDDIRWVRDSAEYAAITTQTYRLATARLEQEARGRAAASWAVVVDADDTIINNLPYQVGLFREGLTHTPERFTAWVTQQASSPVPGARGFLARVRSLGGRIAVVTNRLAIECPDTASVLQKNGLEFDAVLCRPENAPATADKNPRFRQVAMGQSTASTSPLEILMFVGDNILDFPGGSQSMRTQGEGAYAEFGVRWFALPNPMYGSWQ